MKKKIILLLLLILVIGKFSYPYARDGFFWYLNNTSFGHKIVVYLDKQAIWSQDKNLKRTDPAYIHALYQLMKDIHEVMVHVKIDYWVDGGTLLGAVRHKGIIPWDDDLDIQIHSYDHEAFVKKAVPLLQKIGYEYNGSKIIVPQSKYQTKPNETPPACDIFTATIINRRLILKGWPHSIQTKDLGQLKLYDFGLFKVYGPQNPIPYLNDLYGTNWAQQAIRGSNHIDKVTQKLSQWLPINLDWMPLKIDESTMKPALPMGPMKDNLSIIKN